MSSERGNRDVCVLLKPHRLIGSKGKKSVCAIKGVRFRFQETTGQWVSLGLELEQRGNDIVGTKKPTGHSLLIDCRLELPFGK